MYFRQIEVFAINVSVGAGSERNAMRHNLANTRTYVVSMMSMNIAMPIVTVGLLESHIFLIQKQNKNI